jgi:hypothetical protein
MTQIFNTVVKLHVYNMLPCSKEILRERTPMLKQPAFGAIIKEVNHYLEKHTEGSINQKIQLVLTHYTSICIYIYRGMTLNKLNGLVVRVPG